jgi:L-2,4-diaminobutyrate decarboxylase
MNLENAYNSENFREQGYKIIDLLTDYLEKSYEGRQDFVLPPSPPEVLLEKYSNLQPKSLEGLLEQVIEDSNHLHNPGYIGHQVVPPLPEAALAGLVSDLLNNGMAIYEMGPSGTAMEKYVIKYLADQIGMPLSSDGVITSGGSIGNLTALLAARQAKAEYDIWKFGNKDSKFAIFVSEYAHYCIDRAVKIMGLGETAIFKVACDDKFKLDIDSLKNRYEEAIARGFKPIIVVGVAGSTGTGTYDPLEQIADFCEEHQLWFHIDAAHGGAAVFSNNHKHLCKGMERADSVVIDFHKMMLVPALATAVLFKNRAEARATFAQKAEYLLYADENLGYDLAAFTMECTKRMISLKIYTILKLYGGDIIREYIDKTAALTSEFADIVKASANWELAAEPESNIICFRYVAPNLTGSQQDEINLHIRNKLLEKGDYYIVHTKINGKVYLRATVMNIFSREKLAVLLKEAEKLA